MSTMNTPATMPVIHESTDSVVTAEAPRSPQSRKPQNTICRKPKPTKSVVNTTPRAIHDVFHALLNGGKARQKRSGLPR